MKLTAVFERERDRWCVTIPEVPGCVSEGRSLAEARRNIREALSTCVDVFPDADALARRAEILEDIRLPSPTLELVARVRRARAQADELAEQAQRATATAARRLTSKGLSLRDVADLLGISHQRVKQLAG